ncbi:MAG: AI-2E family transporter, partial [Bacteroides sp.]
MEKKKITFDSFIRGTLGFLLIIGALMLVERLSGVLLPFFIAWLIAYLIYPLVKFFQYKLRLKSRIAAIFCALLTLLAIGVGAFYSIVPPMLTEFNKVNTLLVTYFTNGFSGDHNIPHSLSQFIHENIDIEALNRLLSEENLLNAIQSTAPKL